MRLLSEFLAITAITADWRRVFPQQRTFVRGVRQALGSLVCLGRRCLTRIIWTNGGQDSSWSAEYFLHSRCKWEPQQLFRPILKSALAYCPQRLVGVALDDTKLRKTGRSIQQAFYQRDPMSPHAWASRCCALFVSRPTPYGPAFRPNNCGGTPPDSAIHAALPAPGYERPEPRCDSLVQTAKPGVRSRPRSTPHYAAWVIPPRTRNPCLRVILTRHAGRLQ